MVTGRRERKQELLYISQELAPKMGRVTRTALFWVISVHCPRLTPLHTNKTFRFTGNGESAK